MEDLDHGRPSTPPHHPTAGVRILRQEIEHIAHLAFPGFQIVSIRQLPSGKSYNNRIYFLALQPPEGGTLSGISGQQAVLKVNGRFFGANKVQNEVACLQLLQQHCPDIPAPRALAWSEDGNVASFATPFETGVCTLGLPTGMDKIQHGGWVLMSQVPGVPMPVAELDEETLKDLGRQLGDIVASLRQDVPRQNYCGNIRLPLEKIGRQGAPLVDGADLTIRDILPDGIKVDEPITSANQYYRLKLTDKMRELETSNTYAPNRYLLGPLEEFISKTLPQIELTGGDNGLLPNEFVLTHYDLSPRNVLVSGNPPRISGLVDFEFAGFFPPVEEFLNDCTANAGNWPPVFYDAYLARLEERGVSTPARGLDPVIWNRSFWLYTLTGSIAPWDLPGSCSDKELRERLREAETEVREMLRNLSSPENRPEQPIQYGDSWKS
ncbi:hypothetical protein ACO1O0_008822 [Amphichorda felina]